MGMVHAQDKPAATPVPRRIMPQGLDAMALVSEEDMHQAIVRLLCTTHNLAEGAGAAPVAAAWKLREALADKKVVTVLSGGQYRPGDLARGPRLRAGQVYGLAGDQKRGGSA